MCFILLTQYTDTDTESFASVSREYSPLDRSKLPAFLPANQPEQVTIFQVLEGIRSLGKTKLTLPIDYLIIKSFIG